MISTSESVQREARSATPAGLLETKLHPPLARAQTVVRDRLLERLRPDPGVKLLLVAAPAGCGKTTLLGMWREAGQRPVAWLTLDDGDNDAVVLWSHVIEALRRVLPAIDVPVAPEQVGAARIVDAVLPGLVNTLAEQADAALVLDDFHRLSGGPARDSVSWFVAHAPSTFQLVVSSRSEPALPLASLRAHGELLEMRADDLGFTAEEAHALLNERLGLGLGRDEIDGLVERTEGWPAGVYLAALSLQGVEDRHAFISRFGGTNRYVVDFLVDEVLEAHDEAAQALMLCTSILDRLCGPLCDAVLDQEGSAELLTALSRTNLFLMPLDGNGEWFRFHHLFAQLLRVELQHREPGLAQTLHRRAFVWYRDHGLLDEAIEHALEGDAFAEARATIDACPDPGILRQRLDAVDPVPRLHPSRNGDTPLSERELVVLRMLGGTLSERDIGRELYLSHNTVHSHARSIYRKLGVSSRAGALDRARQLGLLSPR